MNIVFFNWRDLWHPKSGGAEFATDLVASELAKKGHDVTWFTSRHAGSPEKETRAGYTVVRHGTELTCRFYAAAWLRRQANDVDVVIDEVNTLPFLSPFIVPDRCVAWILQLAREVWLAEAPPIASHIGYFLEPIMLRIYRKSAIVTISNSSAKSIRQLGLAPVHVAEIALEEPNAAVSEPIRGRIGYVGRLAPSKRIDHIIRALAIVRKERTDAELFIIGTGSAHETQRLKTMAVQSALDPFVHFTGLVSRSERDALMSTFDVLAMASLREGWGLVVSEAARYGVPSVVYPVCGLIDSVVDGSTGLVTSNESPEALASGILRLLNDRTLRFGLGANAMAYLRQFDKRRFVDRFEAVLLDQARTAGRLIA